MTEPDKHTASPIPPTEPSRLISTVGRKNRLTSAVGREEVSDASPEVSVETELPPAPGVIAVGTELDPVGTKKWDGYLKHTRSIMDGIEEGSSADMRLTHRMSDEFPDVWISTKDGTANISPLLQPGATLTRHRPMDKDGDVIWSVRTTPYLSESRARGKVWRLGLREGERNVTIALKDLVASADSDGRSWRLNVPESLPDDYACLYDESE